MRAAPERARALARIGLALALVSGCHKRQIDIDATRPPEAPAAGATRPPEAPAADAPVTPEPASTAPTGCGGCELDNGECGEWWEDGDSETGETVAGFLPCDPRCCTTPATDPASAS